MTNWLNKLPAEFVEEKVITPGGLINMDNRIKCGGEYDDTSFDITDQYTDVYNSNDASVAYWKYLQNDLGLELLRYTRGYGNGTQVSVDMIYKEEKIRDTNFIYFYTLDTYKRGKYKNPKDHKYVFRLYRFPETFIEMLAKFDKKAFPYIHIYQGRRTSIITTKK